MFSNQPYSLLPNSNFAITIEQQHQQTRQQQRQGLFTRLTNFHFRLTRPTRLAFISLFCLIIIFVCPPFIIAWTSSSGPGSMKLCLPISFPLRFQRISSSSSASIHKSLFSYTCQNQGQRLSGDMTTLSPPIAIEQSHDVDATSADATGNGVGVGSGSGIGNVDGGNGIEFGRLAAFLQSQKESFLGEIREGRGKGWTVVMGNEAGDLDTLASSIAFSFLSSTLLANRTVPLSLTPSTLLGLRPENLLAFKLANVPPTTLLHTEQLTSTSALTTSGVEYALVDHNKLLPPFGPGIVNAIIDHHDDEGAHPDAGVRVIQVPTGSCASLVTRQFRKQWESSLSSPAGLNGSPVPPELATLLLSAILIDTNGLKSGGKATPTDYESAAFLYPLLTLSSSSDTQSLSVSSSSVPDGLSQVATQLLQTKFDVSGFSTHDLLLRDYKEYSLSTSSKAYPVVQLGLSTVPVALKISLDKEQDGWTSYLSSLDDYMVEKQLDIEGVLTSYQSEKKNKHKRELLLVVRVGGAIPDSATAKKVLDELSIGLEASQVLQLGEWAKKGFKRFLGKKVVLDDVKGGRHAKVWQQGNAKATRKQVAPILRDLIAKLQ